MVPLFLNKYITLLWYLNTGTMSTLFNIENPKNKIIAGIWFANCKHWTSELVFHDKIVTIHILDACTSYPCINFC